MKKSVIEVEDLKKWFPVRMGFFESIISRKEYFLRAVDGISFHVEEGEIFGLVGESGSGKTTTGRVLLRLTEPTAGKIYFQGKEISNIPPEKMKEFRSKMQIIFQDPYESLNPRMTIFDIIAEPLSVLQIATGEEIGHRVRRALEDVEIVPPEEFTLRFPHELSGGQRQRIAVARALVLNPAFIVADEPVSMLDVSTRAEVLNLMLGLIHERARISILYITHDIALARHMCDRIAVMYLGKIMEMGQTEKIVYEPLHPYTRALIRAVPVPDPKAQRSETVIKGEMPSPINLPSGCRFHTRCPEIVGKICQKQEPQLIDAGNNHYVACHLYT